jgi:aromatic aminotransferase
MRAGIVYWAPPAAALEAVAAAASDPELSQYGPDAGMPALREALIAKLAAENSIHQVSVGNPSS